MPHYTKSKKWMNAIFEYKLRQKKHNEHKRNYAELKEKLAFTQKTILKRINKKIENKEYLTHAENFEFNKIIRRTVGDKGYLRYLAKKVERTK